MKKLTYFLGIALMATSMAFVSCEDDESSTNNNQKPPANQNDINLAEVNIADNYFYLTEAFCQDWTSEQAQWIQGCLQAGTLYYDLYHSPNQVDNNYKGARFNLISESNSEVDFYVEEYNPATQYLELSTDEDFYSGTVTLTQDAEKVYMSWEGESYREGQSAILEGWQLKSKIK